MTSKKTGSQFTEARPKDLKKPYHGKESYAEAISKLDLWANQYSKMKFAKSFIELKPRPKNWMLTKGKEIISHRDYQVVIKNSHGRETSSLISIFLNNTKPGVVEYRGSFFQMELLEEGEYPLIDLDRFNSLNEAKEWMKNNPGFYNWNKFIDKI